MASESEKIKTDIETAGMTGFIFAADREGMCLQNRSEIILDRIIDMHSKTVALPITMRKLYAYKAVSIKEKVNPEKVVPLVLRKKLMYEKLMCG